MILGERKYNDDGSLIYWTLPVLQCNQKPRTGQRKDVQRMADYGYFGKGAEGYAHYTQTFNSTFSNSSSGNSYHSGKPTRKYSDLAIEMANERRAELDKQEAAQKTTYNKADYTDPDLESATLNALFGVGMFALAVAIFMAIFLSI